MSNLKGQLDMDELLDIGNKELILDPDESDRKVFTVTVDFTVDLDAILADMRQEFEDNRAEIEIAGETVEQVFNRAKEQLEKVWDGSDMDIVNIVMEDIADALEDDDIMVKPVGFRRSE